MASSSAAPACDAPVPDTATGSAGGSEDKLLAALQLRLKPPGKRTVKMKLVAAAADLARDPKLTPKEAYRIHEVPAGDARTRVIAYRKRIIDEKMLEVAESNGPPPSFPPSTTFGLPESLLVQQHWINEHTGILELTTEPLTVSSCGRYVTRTIVAKTNEREEVRGEVTYDLPPASGEDEVARRRRAKMHRGREEAALRALDERTAAKHRAKRAKQRHDERQHEEDVADVLLRLLATVERRHEREARLWRCRAGAASLQPASHTRRRAPEVRSKQPQRAGLLRHSTVAGMNQRAFVVCA